MRCIINISNNSNTKIAIGLSGGVDSSVAAYLLKQQGFDVIGIFMKNWEETIEPNATQACTYAADLADVAQVCHRLDIPLYTINFSLEYWENVFSHFLKAYSAGYTPNPDILCNKEIKFKLFLQYAESLKATHIATGHYAGIQTEPEGPWLTKALDKNKDQTYFLAAINKAVLPRVHFPLSHLTKPEVRAIAAQLGLPNHAKKDSTGICFIGERQFQQFLSQYVTAQPGLIKTTSNETLGEHPGVLYFTLGQRKGIQIGGVRGAQEKPWYVIGKDNATNTLYVTQDPDHPWQFSTTLLATETNFLTPYSLPSRFQATAAVRYRQTPVPVTVTVQEDTTWIVTFDTPQKAVTPGQTIVLYDENRCLGGATIAYTDSPGGLLNLNKRTFACASSMNE